MATKTSPSRRSGGSGSRSRPSKKAASRNERNRARRSRRRRPSGQSCRPGRATPWASGSSSLSLLAVLVRCGSRRAGPWAGGSTWLIRGSFGVGAYAFPVLGAWWGFVLLRDIAREDRVRMASGSRCSSPACSVSSPCSPGTRASPMGEKALAEAGGIVGALAAWPLARVISPIGAAIVCAGLASLGLLIFTGTPFAAVKEKIDTFREERDERDPVSAKAEGRGTRRSPAAGGRSAKRSASATTSIRLPEVDDDQDSTETIPAVPEEPEFPSDPPLPAASGARSRTVRTPVRAVPAPAARPAPDRASVERGRARREGHAGGTRADAPHVRRRRPGRRRPPGADRHDVRGRGGVRARR